MLQNVIGNNMRTRKEKPSSLKILWNQRYLMVLVLPVVIWMVIFNYIPMLGLIISFQEFNPYLGSLRSFTESPWVGFANFVEAFTDRYFLAALWNTVLYSLLNLAVGFPVPIIFAVLMNEINRLKFKKIVQTVSYLPHFISWVFVIGFVHLLLAVDNGPINEVLISLGIVSQPIPFLASPGYVPPLIVILQLWKSFGWNSIIYIAAITSIDQGMYEAATVDGASRFAKIRYITLPSIKPTIFIMLIFNIGGLISANFGLFEQLYLLSNALIQDATEIVDTYTYKMGIIQSRYSYATAVGLFRSVVAIILLTSANFTSRKVTGESLF